MTGQPIILIDDDSEDTELIREVIRDLEYDNPVITFTDPVKALAYFRDNKEDVFFIICDLNMPKVSGLQLRKEMMGFGGYNKNTHFYLLSTGNTVKDRESASYLNVTDYLIKPTSVSEIKEVMKIVFDRAVNASK